MPTLQYEKQALKDKKIRLCRLQRGLWKRGSSAGILLLLAVALSGCLYPGGEEAGGPASYSDSVRRVQGALDDYYRDKSVLPILNADETVPRYEKFRINLDQLKQTGYLDDIPATAFERGGRVYFLVQNEERDPTVKVMDLLTVQRVNDIQRLVDRYKSANGGALPAGAERYPGVYEVDKELADAGKLTVDSVYSGRPLDMVMDRSGVVYVDYAPDIITASQQKEGLRTKDGDARELLTAASDHVPVKSLPYVWEGEAPAAVPDTGETTGD